MKKETISISVDPDGSNSSDSIRFVDSVILDFVDEAKVFFDKNVLPIASWIEEQNCMPPGTIQQLSERPWEITLGTLAILRNSVLLYCIESKN